MRGNGGKFGAKNETDWVECAVVNDRLIVVEWTKLKGCAFLCGCDEKEGVGEGM